MQSPSSTDFLRLLSGAPMSMLDLAVALLYLAGASDATKGLTVREIDEQLHSAGHPRQNLSRLNANLRADRRTVRAGADGWRLSPKSRRELGTTLPSLGSAQRLPERDSVLPHGMFDRSRGYINRVLSQINQSYDLGLYDCCAVMCRRLLETLIIESFERAGRSDDLKGTDGNFHMLSGLVSVLEKDKSISLSRNGLRGLRDFKALGDLSAHNRRFNAQASDIDRVRDGLRVTVQELLHLAGLHSSN